MGKLKKILAIVLILMLLTQTVYALDTTIDTSKKGSITINMLQDSSGNAISGNAGTGETETYNASLTPLGGVGFSIYKVGDEDTLAIAQGKVDSTTNPISATASGTTATTGTIGQLVFSNLNVGRYLVRATSFPENVHVELDDFLVDVPTRNAAGTAWNYNVIIYPKVQTVYASIVLNLADDNGNPLPGGQFKLYKYDEDANEYVEYGDSVLTTNANGQIVIDGLPAGDYRLIETSAPSGYGLNTTPIDYTINGPTTKTTTDGVVTIEPTVSGDIVSNSSSNYLNPTAPGSSFEFSKDSGDGVSTGYMIDEDQHWKITSDVPTDFEHYTRYLIVDTISSKLLYDSTSLVVKGISNNTPTTLTSGTDYVVNYTSPTLKVAFKNFASLEAYDKLTIEFDTKFDRNQIVMGEAIQNSADVYFDTDYDGDDDTNDDPFTPTGDDLTKKDDVDETSDVHTGGYKFTKTNSSNQPLSGAKFKLATSEANAKANIFVQIDAADLEATSNASGIVEFSGLAYDSTNGTTYYLVETLAPDGYNLLKSPLAITVNSTSHSSPQITVENKSGLVLPITGGSGIIIFMVIGGGLMIIAFIIMKRSKKEGEE